MVGSILTGAFAAQSLGGSEPVAVSHQLGLQMLACAATAGWSVALTWVCLKVADLALGVRVDDEQEVLGLDVTAHEERGYDY